MRTRGQMTCDRCGAVGARHLGRGGALCAVCAGLDLVEDCVRQEVDPIAFRGITGSHRAVLVTHAFCSAVVVAIAFPAVDMDGRFVIWAALAPFGGLVPAAVVAPHRWGPFVVVGSISCWRRRSSQGWTR